MLYFCFNPSVIAVVIAHSLEDGEFVAQIPYFPPLQVLKMIPMRRRRLSLVLLLLQF